MKSLIIFKYLNGGKSNCESDLKLENGNYDAELAKEQKEFREEIWRMIGGEQSPLNLDKFREYSE